VPNYDVLVADIFGHALPIQVKASRSTKWQSNALLWMDFEVDSQTEVQRLLGRKTLQTPGLVYACVALAPPDSINRDRFFILTMTDLQNCCVRLYSTFMDKHGWERPRKPNSFELRYEVEDLNEFKDNWALIGRLLHQ
jgi:hypothetical protein